MEAQRDDVGQHSAGKHGGPDPDLGTVIAMCANLYHSANVATSARPMQRVVTARAPLLVGRVNSFRRREEKRRRLDLVIAAVCEALEVGRQQLDRIKHGCATAGSAVWQTHLGIHRKSARLQSMTRD